MRVVFDIDGTLCFNGYSIDSVIVRVLEQLKKSGHELIFASARPIRDLLPVVEKIDYDALIGGNGSIISKNGQIQVTRSIKKESYHRILELIQRYQLAYIVDDEWDYSAKVSTEHPIYQQLDPNNLAKNVLITQIVQPIKIILLSIPPQTYQQIYQELQTDRTLSLITHMHEGNLDITAQGINKFTTLQTHFSQIEYSAFGNDSNDVELLVNAKQSYFIGSKQMAHQLHITESQILPKDSQQIATAIEKLC